MPAQTGAYLVEFAGTFAVALTALLSFAAPASRAAAPLLVGAALAALLLLAPAGSGWFNPALTLARAFAKKDALPWADAGVLVAAQAAGALSALAVAGLAAW
jgi:hypothetical protein